jgi:shikimate dehydrogenase
MAPDGPPLQGSRQVRAGLVGRAIGPSRTPAMHEAEGRALGIAYTYDRLDMDTLARPDSDLATVLREAEEAGYAGLNITHPFKIAVIDHLDALSDNARAVGAVNTVVFEGGRRHGHNTDLWGFAESVRREMDGAAREEVLLLGAGGAGAAVAHALLALGTGHLWLHDTDRERADTLRAALQRRFGARRAERAAAPEAVADRIDGLVNATPVGMAKHPGCPVPRTALHAGLWVADIVYFPLETQLLAAARAAGCRVLPGSGMAVHQAARAFELFTGSAPDPGRMRATFESLGP